MSISPGQMTADMDSCHNSEASGSPPVFMLMGDSSDSSYSNASNSSSTSNETSSSQLMFFVQIEEDSNPSNRSVSASPARTSETSESPPISIEQLRGMIKYPDISRDQSMKDDYYGKLIDDPYRWLEGGSVETNDQVKEFINKQQKLMKIVKRACKREIDNLLEMSQSLKKNYCQYKGVVRKKGTDEHFYTDGNRIFLRKGVLSKEEEDQELEFNCNDSLLDVDLSPDGKFAALFLPKDMKYQSSEWRSLQFLNLETREVYSEHLKQGIFF